jgi:glyoxylase-like metal-dependent hydrolase (beta-lactamase superfamily II)
VSWLEGTKGGNIAISSGPHGAIVIDTYVPNAKEQLEKAVADSVGELPVRLVLNTHWHGDHTGNNASYGKHATIVAHDNVRRRLLGDHSMGGRTAQGTLPAALPLVTFAEDLSFHLNGERVRIHHFPAAHTDGDSAAFFEGSKVLHTGDLFFNGLFPFIDLDSGGSVDGYVAAVEALLDELPGDWTVIPGHGPLASKTDLEFFLEMLQQTRGLVKESLEAGLKLEDMKAQDLLEPWKQWSWGFISVDSFLETLVRGLK